MARFVTVRPDNEALVAAFSLQECAYCRSSIVSGERWVREKIYERLTVNGARYRRYHADLFAGEELSCWEKHQMEQETAQAADRAA